MVEIILTIPEQVLKDLIAGSAFDNYIKCKMQLTGGSNKGRLQAIQKQAKKRAAVAVFNLTDNEKQVLDYWNNHTYIKGLENNRGSEARNFPVTLSEVKRNRRNFKRCVDTIGIIPIKALIEDYFTACSKDAHIWDGVNHGFKNLIGICNKILKAHKDKQELWWVKKRKRKTIDKNEDYTYWLADLFAVEFLNKDKYGIENPSREYTIFMNAALKVKAFLDNNKSVENIITENTFIEYLFKAIRKHVEALDTTTDYIYPGYIDNKTVWDVVLPQLLEDLYPSIIFKW